MIAMPVLTVVPSLAEFLAGANIKFAVQFAVVKSHLGLVLVATIDKFLVLLKFLPERPLDGGFKLIESAFPDALSSKEGDVSPVLDVTRLGLDEPGEVPVLAQGSALQGAVWHALLTIPVGCTRFYSDVAADIGQARAVRAVASAVGRNPVAFLVPCHRVIGKNGNVLKFGAGPDVKRRLMGHEGIPCP